MKLIQKNKQIIIFYSLVILISIGFLLNFSKSSIHLYINSFHNSFTDIFFKYITYLGDGLAAVFVSLLLLFIKYKWGAMMATANIFAGITAQLLKRTVFAGSFRPAKFFEGTDLLHLVDGVNLHQVNSMPSGHTATGFAIFVLLAFIVSSKYLKFGFMILAVLIGFSRVYLSQHFLADIVVGSVIGLIWAALAFLYFEKKEGSKWEQSLTLLFRKKN